MIGIAQKIRVALKIVKSHDATKAVGMVETTGGINTGALCAPGYGHDWATCLTAPPPHLKEFCTVPSHIECLFSRTVTVLPDPDFEHFADSGVLASTRYEQLLRVD